MPLAMKVGGYACGQNNPIRLRSLPALKLLDQLRQVNLDNVPEDIQVDLHVPMSEYVAGADDLSPWNRRMRASDLLGNVAGRFADYFDEAFTCRSEDAV